MDGFRTGIEAMADGLAVLTAVDLTALDDDELCAATAAVERAGRQLDTLRAVAAGEIDERSRRGLGSDALATRRGCRGAAHLLERLTHVSQGEASRRVRLGRAVRAGSSLTGERLAAPHPDVAAALSTGDIGVEAASVIVRCLDDALATASSADILVAERHLVEAAQISPADEVAVQARVWREALDPDGAEPRDERLHRKRALVLAREVDGLTRFSGALEPVGAALLRSAFAEADKPSTTPRFVSEADELAGVVSSVRDDGTGAVEFLDRRTREQRHYDVLTGLLTAGVRASGDGVPVGVRSTATVTAVITLDDLRSAVANAGGGGGADARAREGDGVAGEIGADDVAAGGTSPDDGTAAEGGASNGSGGECTGPGDFFRPRGGLGWLDGVAEPVSAATVRRLVCEAGFAPLLLGDDGEVLHYGRTRRLFSPAQLTAMAVRDGGCINCGAPPGWCDGHHVVSWKDGGPTDIDNGALLCRSCHTMIHASGYRLRMIGGRPWVLAPPGLDPGQTWRPLRNHRLEALTKAPR
jgi:hypothetical protein